MRWEMMEIDGEHSIIEANEELSKVVGELSKRKNWD